MESNKNAIYTKMFSLYLKELRRHNVKRTSDLSTALLDLIPFVKELSKKDISMVVEMLQMFVQLLEKDVSTDIVYVFSNVELTSVQKKRLISKVSERFSDDIDVEFVLDKSISGGIVIKYADTLIDLSVDKKLDNLRKAFK
jgi:ATP synthase F1 delta subunit